VIQNFLPLKAGISPRKQAGSRFPSLDGQEERVDMNTFKELGISADYCKGLEELGICEPTEVQAKTIPQLLGKKSDFIGQAQTGTGKTAAFGLPLLANVNADKAAIQALVLAPTRELAHQIQKQLFRFTKYSEKIFSEVVCGGEKIDRQIAALQRPTQILVATPGRLVDLLKRNALNLSEVETVVLDEADEMLKMGFRDDMETALKATKAGRNIWLFSATMPAGIKKMISKHLDENAPFLRIDKQHIVNRNIRHQFHQCLEEEKLDVVLDFLKQRGEQQGLIFCRTRTDTATFGEKLAQAGISCATLHGELDQTERDKIMRAFIKKRVRVVVTTDVAARGIDVKDLTFVIHVQLPEKSEYYTHRSGRTARAGKSGISLALGTRQDEKRIAQLEKELSISFSRLH
jgi:ATP-dependent RNA helicase DeaD